MPLDCAVKEGQRQTYHRHGCTQHWRRLQIHGKGNAPLATDRCQVDVRRVRPILGKSHDLRPPLFTQSLSPFTREVGGIRRCGLSTVISEYLLELGDAKGGKTYNSHVRSRESTTMPGDTKTSVMMVARHHDV